MSQHCKEPTGKEMCACASSILVVNEYKLQHFLNLKHKITDFKPTPVMCNWAILSFRQKNKNESQE